MQQAFTLELADAERKYLLDLVRLSIVRALNGKVDEDDLPPPPAPVLEKELGAFVTLNKNGRLRGCIGNIVGNGPLYKTVARMAVAAAFHDPRFPALQAEELDGISCEVSVLGPIEPCKDPEQVVIGHHGLIMKKGLRQGLLLPQVPVEWGWDRVQFLRQTCVKAGLPQEQWEKAWKDEDTQLYWFEALIFNEG